MIGWTPVAPRVWTCAATRARMCAATGARTHAVAFPRVPIPVPGLIRAVGLVGAQNLAPAAAAPGPPVLHRPLRSRPRSPRLWMTPL